jgi:hypothetical protein
MRLNEVNPEEYYALSRLSEIVLRDGRRLDEALKNHPIAPEPLDYSLVPNGKMKGKYFKGQTIIDFAGDVNNSCFLEIPEHIVSIFEEVSQIKADRDKIALEIQKLKAEARSVSGKVAEAKQTARDILGRFFEEYILGPDDLLKSGQVCGVYFLRSKGQIVYVGQSVNILSRVGQHQVDKEFDGVSFVRCKKESLNDVEGFFISLLQPKLNGRGPTSSIQCFDDMTALLLSNGNSDAPE